MRENPEITSALEQFIAELPPAARVLDLGCGPGLNSARMAEAGLSPDPLDATPAMVALARDTHGLPARLGDFSALEPPYHGIWASYSLLHMPRAGWPAYLSRLFDSLHPGGLLFLALKTGQGEARDPIGRRYSYFDPAEITDWLGHAGFRPDPPTLTTGRGLAGTEDAGFTMLARKPSD